MIAIIDITLAAAVILSIELNKRQARNSADTSCPCLASLGHLTQASRLRFTSQNPEPLCEMRDLQRSL